jgi:phage tail sheath protein FI
MATSYRTPGVYVEEISKFPPSVAQVETAIPAFVGYTEQAVVDGEDYHNATPEKIIRPVKISSLPEFEFYFGGAPNPTNIEVELKADNSVKSAKVNSINLLYDSVRMFYANGGGECFIVSVGGYNSKTDDVKKEDLLAGLTALEKEDLPTLLVIPESVHLSEAQAGEVHAAMLAQCNKLQDRFAVLDLVGGQKEITPSDDPVTEFRSNVGMNYLKYGAAYYPWIKTTLPFKIDYDAILAGTFKKEGANIDVKTLFNSDVVESINNIDDDISNKQALTADTSVTIDNKTSLEDFAKKLYADFAAFYSLSLEDDDSDDSNSAISIHEKFKKENTNFHGLVKTLFEYNHFSETANSDSPWNTPLLDNTFDFVGDFSDYTFSNPTTDRNDIYTATSTAANAAPYFKALADKLERLIENFYTELQASRKSRTELLREVDPVYGGIVNAISSKGVVLPPSGAVVGKYASVDRERGVWKSPANVSITAVKAPSVNITHEEQGDLNIDTEAGKSVNAIRAFTGKGTLIWGARTLAGNDNEWRYISVRRFFNMVEESVKKATSQFVFEPNDANTWVKVRAMIENFLTLQWRAGALAGAKQDQAFYVRVGLGQTMTAQDILNGYMHVEIGMAVVRPAEFIVLKFSHKMQES